ncbi:MAG: T9SS type A sorting domain-containing protein [bacterium]
MSLLVPRPSAAQVTFEKTFGGTDYDCGFSVQQGSDGGYSIAGHTTSFGAGLNDVYVVKTDALGNTLWDRTYGGADEDMGYSVRQTLDGGYVIAGETRSSGAGQRDVYLIKTDASGNVLWEATHGGNRADGGRSIRQTLDDGYIITGETRSSGLGQRDVYLIKTDGSGNVVWEKTFGDTRADCGYSVRETMDGSYVIAGEMRTSGVGVLDVYLIKTDTLGNAFWTMVYGGTGADGGYSLQQTLEGGYIVTGYTESFGAGRRDVYLIKTDSSGSPLWEATYGGASNDEGYSVQQTEDGGYIIAGYTESFGTGQGDVYLIRTDAVGNTLWERTYGGALNDYGYSVEQTVDGGYIIVGYTESFGAGLADVYLIKTDADGLVGIAQEGVNHKTRNAKLLQNTPNPFSGYTTISYSLAEAGHTTLDVYDVAGSFVKTLVNKRQERGVYQVSWDATDRPSGIYFYRLGAGDFTSAKKMLLLR